MRLGAVHPNSPDGSFVVVEFILAAKPLREYAEIDYVKTDYVKGAFSPGWRCESQPMPKSVFTEAYASMLVNLIALRKERGVSQVELAARLGKEQPFVSRVERGERRIDVVEFYAIALALGLEPIAAYAALIKGLPRKVSI